MVESGVVFVVSRGIVNSPHYVLIYTPLMAVAFWGCNKKASCSVNASSVVLAMRLKG